MSRRPATFSFLQPIKSDGTLAPPATVVPFANGRGCYQLGIGTWFVMLGGQDASMLHAHVQGDATLVATSMTIEDTDMPAAEVSDVSDTGAGDWIATPAGRITAASEGTGWTMTTGVLAVTGGTAGGGTWSINDNAARRTRIKIVVTTAGAVRFSGSGKES